MRAVQMEVHPDLLAGMFAGHPWSKLDSDWPADALIIDARWDSERSGGRLFLLVTSSTFDDMPDGARLPVWTPTYRTTNVDAAVLEMAEVVLNVVRDAQPNGA